MTGKFHISSDGQPRACRATKVACKLNSDHYDTKEEAQAAYEKLNEAKANGGSLKKNTSLNTIPKLNRAIKDIDDKLASNESVLKEVGVKALARIAKGESLGGFEKDYKDLSATKDDLTYEKEKLLKSKAALEDKEAIEAFKKPALINSVSKANSMVRDLDKRIKAQKTVLRDLDKKIVNEARNNNIDEDLIKKFDKSEKEVEEFSTYRTNIIARKKKLDKDAMDEHNRHYSSQPTYYGGGCGGGRAC